MWDFKNIWCWKRFFFFFFYPSEFDAIVSEGDTYSNWQRLAFSKGKSGNFQCWGIFKYAVLSLLWVGHVTVSRWSSHNLLTWMSFTNNSIHLLMEFKKNKCFEFLRVNNLRKNRQWKRNFTNYPESYCLTLKHWWTCYLLLKNFHLDHPCGGGLQLSGWVLQSCLGHLQWFIVSTETWDQKKKKRSSTYSSSPSKDSSCLQRPPI